MSDVLERPDRSAHADVLPMLLTVKDLEKELQLGRTRTYELVRSGDLPVIRIGRAVRIPLEALRQWVEAQAAGVQSSGAGRLP